MANEKLYHSKMLIGALYRSELASRLQDLGYGIEKSHADGRFEIAGVSREVVEAFSTRRWRRWSGRRNARWARRNCRWKILRQRTRSRVRSKLRNQLNLNLRSSIWACDMSEAARKRQATAIARKWIVVFGMVALPSAGQEKR